MKDWFTQNKKWERHIILLSVLFFFGSCQAPAKTATDSTFSQALEIPVSSKLFTTDKIQQVYLVTAKNEVIKYRPDGKEQFRYNNNRLGELKLIDVTDPFNILLYYPDYQTAVTLDRTLSQTGEIELLNLNLLEVNAIGMSNDNNIWLYDENNTKLKKVNRKSEVVLESDQLNMVLGFVPKPDFILERENLVYINDPENGVLVFDNFGQYIRTLDLKGLTGFQILDNQLIYRDSGKLKAFNLRTLVTSDIELPETAKAEDQIRIQKGKLFVRKADRVLIYKF